MSKKPEPIFKFSLDAMLISPRAFHGSMMKVANSHGQDAQYRMTIDRRGFGEIFAMGQAPQTEPKEVRHVLVRKASAGKFDVIVHDPDAKLVNLYVGSYPNSEIADTVATGLRVALVAPIRYEPRRMPYQIEKGWHKVNFTSVQYYDDAETPAVELDIYSATPCDPPVDDVPRDPPAVHTHAVVDGWSMVQAVPGPLIRGAAFCTGRSSKAPCVESDVYADRCVYCDHEMSVK